MILGTRAPRYDKQLRSEALGWIAAAAVPAIFFVGILGPGGKTQLDKPQINGINFLLESINLDDRHLL
jgi:hypothetical protein